MLGYMLTKFYGIKYISINTKVGHYWNDIFDTIINIIPKTVECIIFENLKLMQNFNKNTYQIINGKYTIYQDYL